MSRQKSADLPYHLSKEALRKDLTEERPPWILSSFGPGRDAPEQLFGGYPREQSFEELRLHYNTAAAAGNPESAINEMNQLYQNAEQQIQVTLGNLDAALQFVIDGEKKHPNRLDVCKQSSQPGGTSGRFSGKSETSAFGGQTGAFAAAGKSLNTFGSAAMNTTSSAGGAFGQPTALGQKPSPFGAPSFGQPASQPAGSSAFGQPSRLGGGFSAFGQPSTLGAKPNPFGAPSPSTGFGQPSQQPAASGFGQPSQPPTASPFGQAATQTPAAAANPFGQPSQTATASPFGQQVTTSAPAFGQPTQPQTAGGAFGQPSALGAKPNPFGALAASSSSSSSPFATIASGQNGATGNQTQTQNPFGQKAQAPSPFGAPSTSGNAPSPFGSSPFGQPAAPSAFGQKPASNPFGQPSQQPGFSSNPPPDMQTSSGNPFSNPPPAPSNPFGNSPFGSSVAATTAATTTTTHPAAPARVNDPYPPDASRKHPPLENYSRRDATGRLVAWKMKHVGVGEQPKDAPEGGPLPYVVLGETAYNERPRRIWFPDGPPAYTPETELTEGEYDDASKKAWGGFVDTGRFVGGVMPVLPPRREWCLWDF